MNTYKDYQYHSDRRNHIHRYVLQPILDCLNPKKNKNILDLGCGNGWLTSILIEQGYNAYGTDASVSGINIAKEKYPERFFIQDLSKDELPEELAEIPFDTIVSTEVIEHIYSPASYLDFCNKLLSKKGEGELILTTPYHGYLKNLALAVTGKMDAHFTVLWEGGHIKFWSRKTLTQALEEHGFEVRQFIGCGRLHYLWKSMLVKAEFVRN